MTMRPKKGREWGKSTAEKSKHFAQSAQDVRCHLKAEKPKSSRTGPIN